MNRNTRIPALLLLTLSLGVAGFHAGTETAGSRLAAVHAAAERAGYAFVVGLPGRLRLAPHGVPDEYARGSVAQGSGRPRSV